MKQKPKLTKNARSLNALKKRHNLTNADVARKAVVGKSTADSWLVEVGKKSHRNMSDDHLKRLKMSLGYIV